MALTIQLKDEVEGENVETSDFFFDRIGEPVPVKPAKGGDGDSKLYDPGCLPSQPLAVSERFQLVFVAHSSGELCTSIASRSIVRPVVVRIGANRVPTGQDSVLRGRGM